MELIEALERLSLEVKNKQGDISATNLLDRPSDWDKLQQDKYLPQYSGESSTSNQYSPVGRHKQLEEFDCSISTLLTQITDLDCAQETPGVQNQPIYKRPDDVFSRRSQYIHNNLRRHQSEYNGANSMETSQEDDSDCSSQRSGYTTFNQQRNHNLTVNHLVRDLLKKDLTAITDTVRKISQILAIGSEIVTKFKNLVTKSSVLVSNDFNYTQSLCNTFMSLCESEPYIRDLPTIIHYTDYCQKLMDHLCSTFASNTTNIFNGQMQVVDKTIVYNNVAYVGREDNQDDEDVEFMDDIMAQPECSIWTENKLYIDQKPN